MALNTKQRARLRRQLGPIIQEALEEGVVPIIQEEVGKVLADAKAEGPSYADRILSGRGRSPRDLPDAAKVFARLGLVQAIGQGDRATALEAARTLEVEDEYQKALSAGSAEGGGLLLQDDQAREIIDLLRPVSVMRQIGAQGIDIPRGTMRTPRIDVGVTSGYVAEGAAIPTSDLKTGQVVLTAKKLAALVVLTNELVQFSGDVNVDAIVLQDMLASIGETEDVKFLFGSGAEAEPLGITKQVAAGNKFDANATVNVSNVVADLRTAMTKLSSADVPLRRPVWIWSPRTSNFLMTLLNVDGQFVFRREIEQGRLFRWPFFETNNIPNDLGGGSDESVIIAADAQEIMLGDVAQVGIDRSGQATVKLDGVDTNLFETDRTAIRVRLWNDIALRHDVGIAVMEAVTWGA